MVEIECLVCGKTIKIPQFINTERYDGQVPCQNCGSLLHIKLVASKVERYKVVEKKFRIPTADELAKIHLEAERELKKFREQRGKREGDKGGGE